MNNIFLLKSMNLSRGFAPFFKERSRRRGARYASALMIAAVFLSACLPGPESVKNQACFKNTCVEVEIVQKEEDMRRGLQFRSFLGENKGMLFVFTESSRHAFL